MSGYLAVADRDGLFVFFQAVGTDPRALHTPANTLPLSYDPSAPVGLFVNLLL